MSLALGLFVWGVKGIVHDATDVFAVLQVGLIGDGPCGCAIRKAYFQVFVLAPMGPNGFSQSGTAKWISGDICGELNTTRTR